MAVNEENKRKWYPVCTNPRAEKKANELLVHKGIETFLPLQKTLKQWSDRKKWVTVPLISSYLFVKITEPEQTEVLMTPGIARFIYFSGKRASVPEKQINMLRLLLDANVELEVTPSQLKKGDMVTIEAGPLKGLEGELISEPSGKRLIIRIEQINQIIKVQVPANWLETIDN